MEIREIDMAAYPRKAHFEYFKSLAYPYVGLTAEVDVTRLKTWCKEKKISFFLTILYLAGNAANDVPEFRRRIVGEGIVEYESCSTSHTVLKPDETYAYCEADPALPFHEFLEQTAKRQEEARLGGGIVEESDPLSLYFVSCLPWVHYTSLIQPVPSPADSNPRITWGRAEEKDGTVLLPVSVLVHHGLVDGKHISDFYEALKRRMDTLIHQF